MNIKMKVAPTVKGRLSLPQLNGVFKSGNEFEYTEDQLESLEVINCINLGVIEFVDKNIKISKFMNKYKNNTKNKIVFSFGLWVSPFQTFFLSVKTKELDEVKHAIKSGTISLEGKAVVEKTKPTRKASKKTIKKVSETLDNKTYVVDPNGDTSKKPTPTGMYIHDPKKPTSEEDEPGSIEFVDVKQDKQRLEKTQKSIKNKQLMG